MNRGLIVERLLELSDEQRQRKLWLWSGGGEVSSFVEAVCGLFDDSALGGALDSGGTEFGSLVDSKFLELACLLDRIDYRLSDADIMRDPQMRDVRKVAKDLLCMIGSLDLDEG